MTIGKVKWFNADKGFGLIEPEGGGDDIVVHRSEILAHGYQRLETSQAVEFDVRHDPTGTEAINVRAVGPLEGPGGGGGDERPPPRE